jgi:hypothetical protein
VNNEATAHHAGNDDRAHDKLVKAEAASFL